jgi:hypothetical protein
LDHDLYEQRRRAFDFYSDEICGQHHESVCPGSLSINLYDQTPFQSVAIIGAALGSWLLFDFVPNFLFLLGMAFVIASICMYTMFPSKQPVQRKSELFFGD